MQIKGLFAALAIPAVVLSAAVPQPQDPEIPYQDESYHIVGGVAAAPGDFPYIVSLQVYGSHYCGGVLLNANTILTAAHCSKYAPSEYKARAGSLVSCAFHKVSLN
jgi:trypsin